MHSHDRHPIMRNVSGCINAGCCLVYARSGGEEGEWEGEGGVVLEPVTLENRCIAMA